MARFFLKTIFTLLPLLAVFLGTQANGSNRVNGNSTFWVSGQREDLPHWITSEQGEGRYIGVSDPCLDSLSANEQAVLRGWFLAICRRSGVNLNILHEEYQQITSIGQYDRVLMKYSSMATFTSRGEVVYFKRGRTHYSMFGECYQELIECQPGVGDDIIKVAPAPDAIMGSYFNYGYEKSVISSRIDITLSLSAICNGKMIFSDYKAKGSYGREILTRTFCGESSGEQSIGKLWYKDSEEGYEPAVAERQTPLRNGIWGAIYESMIFAMVSEPTYGYKIKQVHESENFDDQNEIMRSIYSSTAHFDFGGYIINDDKMLARWSYMGE